MTLAELIAKAQAVNSQISTAWIPLKSDGRDIDIDLSLIEDKEGYAVNVRITHTESCTESSAFSKRRSAEGHTESCTESCTESFGLKVD